MNDPLFLRWRHGLKQHNSNLFRPLLCLEWSLLWLCDQSKMLLEPATGTVIYQPRPALNNEWCGGRCQSLWPQKTKKTTQGGGIEKKQIEFEKPWITCDPGQGGGTLQSPVNWSLHHSSGPSTSIHRESGNNVGAGWSRDCGTHSESSQVGWAGSPTRSGLNPTWAPHTSPGTLGGTESIQSPIPQHGKWPNNPPAYSQEVWWIEIRSRMTIVRCSMCISEKTTKLGP